MGTNKLIEQLTLVLESSQESKGRKQCDALKKVLKKLKAKQKSLESKLGDASGQQKDKLAKKIKTVRAHRKKALKMLKDQKVKC